MKRLKELNKESSAKRSAAPLPPRLSSSYRGPGDDQRASWLTFWLGSALIFVALLAAAVFFGTMSIERDLSGRAEEILAANGFDTIEVKADGGALLFTGTYRQCTDPCDAPMADPYGLIDSMVGGIPGVASVDASQLYEVEGPAVTEPGEVTGEAINAEWAGGTIRLWGDVSSSDTRSLLIQRLNATNGVASVDAEELSVLDGLPSEAEWIDEVAALLADAVAQVPEGMFFINPSAEVFSVSATTESRQLKKDIADEAGAITAAFGFAYLDGLIIPEAQVTREQVEELQEELDELVLNQVVEFELDSARLTVSGKALLDEVLAQIQLVPEIPIEIHGHASSDGAAAKNLALSEERAVAVRDYLVANGADPNRFIVYAWGDTKPIADNSTEEGRAKNRRIEFTAVLEEG